MRSTLTALLIALSTLICTTASAEPRSNLTVLLSIEGRTHDAALAEMKSELKDIMKDAGKTVDIRMRSEAQPNENFDDVVLVKLKGNCRIDRLVHLIDERGPLAFTHSTDGAILPFAEVACDRLSNSVARALFGEEKKRGDKLLGRAIGRVLAHELYHILGKTHEHNEDGSLAKEAISAKQLIADKRITFDMRDLHRMAP